MLDIKNIGNKLKLTVSGFTPEARSRQTGQVIYCADGVIKLSGLSQIKYNELIEFENGAVGIALNLESGSVGAVLLSDANKVKLGDFAYSTGRTVDVPVGTGLLGRVITPLGEPLDDLGNLEFSAYRPVEYPAPAIIDRVKITQPLETGILAIDSMIPIGKGQRELIIGDRQTGKTAIAVDTILNQKGKGVYCVYVAIGQKASTVSNIASILKQHGALEYTVIVCSTASDPAPLQYLAPYSGCAVAEHFMYAGKDALIVYDDLSKHAVSYRTMSLLLKRPAGREAYPGDVFYLHSRLLERAAKLKDEVGGGSLTALPIIETQAGDISSYIPTNVISITDGQIYLESELFNSGVRPAVNVGLSVSRVGGSAQYGAIRSISGTLRLNLAQYRELQIFSQFGSELDKVTREILLSGDRITETLKQQQYKNYTAEEMVILLTSVQSEAAQSILPKDIKKFNGGFLAHLRSVKPELISEVAQQINTKLTAELKSAIIAEAESYKIFLGN